MFLCIQKINFISNYFFEMLQRHCKLAIMRTLGILAHPCQISMTLSWLSAHKKSTSLLTSSLSIPGHTPLKLQYQFEENLMFICRQKKSTSSYKFSLRYCKDIAKLLFWLLWIHTPKVILSTCRKLLCLSARKKSTSSPTFFWGYCKDIQTSHFGYFRHA